jgi:hypothetical protein
LTARLRGASVEVAAHGVSPDFSSNQVAWFGIGGDFVRVRRTADRKTIPLILRSNNPEPSRRTGSPIDQSNLKPWVKG